MADASASTPVLSVIIPSLNEEDCLPLLLQDLLRQRRIAFEILISDGESRDLTCSRASELLGASGIPHRIVSGPPGRGRQLNRAVRRARGAWLLFLHADSRLPADDALEQALNLLGETWSDDAPCRVAGRFRLRFDSSGSEPADGLFFCEAKARLGEAGCIHGDQGFLLCRRFYDEVGPFREDLPVMEDTWMAEAIREKGQWLLLPGEIRTSARRFAAEGFERRQVLNALLMNFLFIGWNDFLRQAPDIYRRQDRSGRLQLLPFWQEIRQRLGRMPLRKRWGLWYATGRFVRSQAWQLRYWREARRCLRQGRSVAAMDSGVVRRFRAWFEPLTGHPPGNALAGLLTWIWFQVVYLRLRRQEE